MGGCHQHRLALPPRKPSEGKLHDHAEDQPRDEAMRAAQTARRPPEPRDETDDRRRADQMKSEGLPGMPQCRPDDQLNHHEPEQAKTAKTHRTRPQHIPLDRKSTRLNSSHSSISYAVFCLKKIHTKSTIPLSYSSYHIHYLIR